MKRNTPLWCGIAASVSVLLVAAPAAAAPAPAPHETLHEGFVSPLKLALDFDGSIYVADSFVGMLDRLDRRGEFSTPYQAAPDVVLDAVSAFAGTVYFAERVGDEETVNSAVVKKMDRRGNVTTIADILAYEKANNPDADQVYGFSDLDPACAALIPADSPFPVTYTGSVDSHPYATLGSPIGTVVADAGSNALFTIDRRGSVRTLAVLPPQPVVVGDWALQFGMPACVIGEEYAFEAVPTDVELGSDGWFYVTLLPGGPEVPGLGARGSVVKVNPWSGEQRVVATGFAGATDLALSPRGDIYVAELFGGRISVVEKGASTPSTWREANAPAAVEWSPNGLYATIDALSDPEAPPAPPAGKLVRFPF